MTWSTRMKIALDAAKGLAFLHGAERPIIYRDFKTSNILLDSVSIIFSSKNFNLISEIGALFFFSAFFFWGVVGWGVGSKERIQGLFANKHKINPYHFKKARLI